VIQNLERTTVEFLHRLSGQKNRYRVRVGDFRIIYAIYDDRLVVIIVDIGNRRDVYRKRGK
jgi:mRNA interferase RelE/StbE